MRIPKKSSLLFTNFSENNSTQLDLLQRTRRLSHVQRHTSATKAAKSRIGPEQTNLGPASPMKKKVNEIYPPKCFRILECGKKSDQTNNEKSFYSFSVTHRAFLKSQGSGQSATFDPILDNPVFNPLLKIQHELQHASKYSKQVFNVTQQF